MNIIFKKLRFKNFMSYGAVMTEVSLNTCQLTGIQGKNGAGKSCIASALIFALYGKSQSKVQKSKIINSINGKELLTEVEFETNGHSYLVRRGIKPNIFEIYQDNVLYNQDASVLDYQVVLEEQILGLEYKAFIQSVIVGSSSFIPFMELTAADKRVFVENLLDISVLTEMNVLLKNKILTKEQEISKANYNLNIIKNNADHEKTIVETLSKTRERNLGNINAEILEKKTSLENEQKELEKRTELLNKLKPFQRGYLQFKENKNSLMQARSERNASIKKLEKDSFFSLNHNSCPFCKQTISDEYKNHIRDEMKEQIFKIKSELAEYEKKLEEMEKTEEKYSKLNDKIYSINSEIQTINAKISMLNSSIIKLNSSLEEPELLDDVNEHKEKIIELAKQYVSCRNEFQKLLKEREIFDLAHIILKDNGIKTAIVNQYLPVINKMVNYYMNELEFYASFNMDGEFNETIKLRERDEMNYFNLSQGERKKLSLALLFCWRAIAQRRNKCATNLLIMDELDDSLDDESSEIMIKLLRKFVGENIFVISHKEVIKDSTYDRIICVEKKNQFSMIDEIQGF